MFGLGKKKNKNKSNNDNILDQSPFGSNENYFLSIKTDKAHRELLEEKVPNSKYTNEYPYFTLNKGNQYLSDLSLANIPDSKTLIQVYEVNSDGSCSLVYDFKHVLSSIFDNVLYEIFKNIFNNKENSGVPYEQLANLASNLKKAYIKSTNADDSSLPLIPKKNEVVIGNTEIKKPQNEDIAKKLSGGFTASSDPHKEHDDKIIYDPNNAEFSHKVAYRKPNSNNNNYDKLNNEHNKDSHKEHNEESNKDSHKEHNEESNKEFKNNYNVYDVKNLSDRLDVSDNLNYYSINHNLPDYSKDPAADDYVSIKENNLKKEYNERIKSSVKGLVSKFTNPLIDEVNNLNKEFKSELDNWAKNNKPTDMIYKDIEDKLTKQKNKSIDEVSKNNKNIKDVQLQNAKKEYDNKVQQINNNYDFNLNKELNKIDDKFNEKLESAKKDISNKANSKFNLTKQDQYNELFAKKQSILEEKILDTRKLILDSANKLFQASDKDIDDLVKKAREDNYHYKQLKNEQLKSQNESKYNELIKEHRKQNNESFENQNKLLEKYFESNSKVIESLSNKDSKSEDPFDKLIKLSILRETKSLNSSQDNNSDNRLEEIMKKQEDLEKQLISKNNEISSYKDQLTNKNRKTKSSSTKLIISICTIVLLFIIIISLLFFLLKPNSATSSSNGNYAATRLENSSSSNKNNKDDNSYSSMLANHEYMNLAVKYPSKINDIENNIFQNEDINALKKFIKVYNTKFGRLDYALLTDNDNRALKLFNNLSSPNLKTKQRTKKMGLILLKLKENDKAKKINNLNPTRTLSNAISNNK